MTKPWSEIKAQRPDTPERQVAYEKARQELELPALYPGEFLRGVVGSTIHGLSISGTDDVDLMGICIENPEQVLGMGKPFEQHVFRTQPEGHPSGPGDVDLTTYSLRKYLKLAANGNPTIINLLFVPPEYRHIDSPLADELRSLAPSIISKEAGARYLGYMQAQRERLLGLRGQKHTGAHRQQYISDVHGYDTKYACHLCRLAVQGIEVMRIGRISFPVPEEDRQTLLEIRHGVWGLDEVVRYSHQLEDTLKNAIDQSPLPDHPDHDKLNSWLTGAYLRNWGQSKIRPAPT